MVKTIQLSRGKQAIVDDEDFEELNRYKWCYSASGRGYAARWEGPKFILMHRQILRPPDGFEPDHINNDGLDNRRANLRIATASQNVCNRGKPAGDYSSQYKGVYRENGKWQTKKWRARIRFGRKTYDLGRFENELVAAIHYDLAARDLHGEFCKGNFTDEELAVLTSQATISSSIA